MRALRRLHRDARGVVAIEFALIAPLMLLIYFGIADLTEGLMASRKVSHVASTIGDLASQSTITTPAQLTDIFSIGQQMLSPFSPSSLQLRITSVTTDANNVPKVDWSRGSNGLAPYNKGAVIALPLAPKAKPSDPNTPFIAAGQSVIMAEAKYKFDSPVGVYLPAATDMKDTFYLHPRYSAQVACNGC